MTPAQILYEHFIAACNAGIAPMPWNELPEYVRSAWTGAYQKALEIQHQKTEEDRVVCAGCSQPRTVMRRQPGMTEYAKCESCGSIAIKSLP